MRLFVAVNLPAEIRRAIQASIDRCPVDNPPWRWASADTWHVTIKFLGETDGGRVDGLCASLARVASRHVSFEATMGPLGGFPNLKRPRVLHFGVVEGADSMAALAADVDRTVAADHDIVVESRPYRAHVTVARIKTPLPRSVVDQLGGMGELARTRFQVDSVDLMRSHLGPQGARYERVKQFALPRAK